MTIYKNQINNKFEKTNFQTATQLFGILILIIRIYLDFVVWNLSFPIFGLGIQKYRMAN